MSNFMTGPSALGYHSTQSPGFIAAKPDHTSVLDYTAEPLGKALAAIGLHEAGLTGGKDNSVQARRAQQEIDENQKKDTARTQIGALVGTLTKDNALDTYFNAMQIGSAAGLGQEETDRIFRGAAASRGADNTTLGRIGDRGGYSADTYFTPEAQAAGVATKRSQSLADEQAKIAEKQREEGVAAGLENTKFGQAKALEQLKSDLEKSRQPAKAPGVAIPELENLRKQIVTTLSDTTGTLPTKEGDFASKVKVEPGLINDVTQRASELTSSPYNLSPVDAIARAIKEKSDVGQTPPTVDLSGIGLGKFGGGDPTIAKKPQDDPLGLR